MREHGTQLDDILKHLDSIVTQKNNPTMQKKENIIYQVNDMRKNKMHYYNEPLKSAMNCVKNRIESYTKAAKLILEYLPNLSKDEKQSHGKSIDQLHIETMKQKTFDCQALNQHISLCAAYFVKNKLIKGKLFSPEKRAFNELLHAENILNWQRKRPTLVSIHEPDVLHDSHAKKLSVIQLDIPISTMSEELKQHYRRCLDKDTKNHPSWFQHLHIWEQRYWQKVIKETQGEISLVMPIQPPTIRCYPGLPNFMLHGLIIYDENYHRQYSVTRYRSSILYPAGMRDKDEASNMAQLNIAQLVAAHKELKQTNKAPVLLAQTLVSALTLPGMLGYERKIREGKQDAVLNFEDNLDNDEMTVIETNYPFNKWHPSTKVIGNFSRKENYTPAQKTIIHLVQKTFEKLNRYQIHPLQRYIDMLSHIRDDKHENDIIDFLPQHHEIEIEVYKATQDISLSKNAALVSMCCQHYLELHRQGSETNRWHGELIPALEELLVSLMDNTIAHASCKSGKDRRAMELMLEDSIIIYHFLFKQFQITKNSSKLSKSHHAQLYLEMLASGHHQTLAEYNARGCLGLKSISGVLTEHIHLQIKKDNLKELLTHNKTCSVLNRPDLINKRSLRKKVERIFVKYEKNRCDSDSLQSEVMSLLNNDHLFESNLIEESLPDREFNNKKKQTIAIVKSKTTTQKPRINKSHHSATTVIQAIKSNLSSREKAGKLSTITVQQNTWQIRQLSKTGPNKNSMIKELLTCDDIEFRLHYREIQNRWIFDDNGKSLLQIIAEEASPLPNITTNLS